MNTPISEHKEYYSPSDGASVNGSGGTATLEFRGLNGEIFAFNRMNIGCDDMSVLDQVLVTAKLNNGRTTLFEDVQLEALRRTFEYHSLKGGLVIEKNKTLELDLTNNHGSALDINIDLNGYDAPSYREKVQQYQQRGETFPTPVFIYNKNTEIAISADQQSVELNLPTEDAILERIFASSESDVNLKFSLDVDNTEILPIRYVSQYNNQFQTMDIIQPILVRNNIVVKALVTNLDGATAYDLSIFCEAYKRTG